MSKLADAWYLIFGITVSPYGPLFVVDIIVLVSHDVSPFRL